MCDEYGPSCRYSLESLPGGKHSSLVVPFVSCEENEVLWILPLVFVMENYFCFYFYSHYFNDWSSEVDLSAFADIHIVILFLGSRSIEEVPLKKKESVVDNMLRPQNIDCFTWWIKHNKFLQVQWNNETAQFLKC